MYTAWYDGENVFFLYITGQGNGEFEGSAETGLGDSKCLMIFIISQNMLRKY